MSSLYSQYNGTRSVGGLGDTGFEGFRFQIADVLAALTASTN